MTESIAKQKRCTKCGLLLNYRRSINEIADGVSLEQAKKRSGLMCKCKERENDI